MELFFFVEINFVFFNSNIPPFFVFSVIVLFVFLNYFIRSLFPEDLGYVINFINIDFYKKDVHESKFLVKQS